MSTLDAILSAAPFARQYATVSGMKVDPATRLNNARIIVTEAIGAGLPVGLALAMVVNAQAESGLSHLASGDGGRSIGLFQLHEKGGGKGMTTAQRQDPHLNTRRIIQEYLAVKAPIEQAYNAGATVADLAGLFAYYVERPADKDGEKTRRAASARLLFPGVADVQARLLQAAGHAVSVVARTGVRVGLGVWLAGGIILGGLLLWSWLRRRRT